MAIIKQYNKRTGLTYAYESYYYWDKEKKQSRAKRKVIGRVDPETGEDVAIQVDELAIQEQKDYMGWFGLLTN